jgi:DNA polymerase-3 subunit gamma/tau
MSIALARRYRPKRFADLLVQDHVTAVLRGAVARERVGHGYLLTGPRGVGKTTAARILAMALNCPNRDGSGEPCGECDECLRIWNGSANLDVIEIDAASNRGVDDARDLRERAMYAASAEGRYKVYIVDEAHMLTREAWNALLKILEEPPPRVVFVFATTEPQKIAATAAPVLSRLQRFDFRRIGPAVIRDRLRDVLSREGIAADEDALTLIARHADGGMRDALSMLDQCLSFGEGAITAERVREILGLAGDEVYAQVLALAVERQPAGVFALVDRLMESGADLGEFMNGAAEMLRALLMLQVGAEPEDLTEAMRQTLGAYRERIEAADVLRMLRLLADQEGAIRRSANPRLAVETLLLRWTMLDRIVDLQQVLESVAAKPAGGAGTPPPAGRPPAGARAAPIDPPRPLERRVAPEPQAVAGRPSGPAPAPAPAPAVTTTPAPTPAPTPAELPDRVPVAAAPAPVPGLTELSLPALRAAWPGIVAAVRERRQFLGEALGGAEPALVAPPWLTIQLPESAGFFVTPLQEQAAVIEEVLTRAVGEPVRLKVTAGGLAPPPASEEPRPKRMSESSIRAERLKTLRAKDPTLDTAADALDLEIVE